MVTLKSVLLELRIRIKKLFDKKVKIKASYDSSMVLLLNARLKKPHSNPKFWWMAWVRWLSLEYLRTENMVKQRKSSIDINSCLVKITKSIKI